jgi:hypothetical protein
MDSLSRSVVRRVGRRCMCVAVLVKSNFADLC